MKTNPINRRLLASLCESKVAVGRYFAFANAEWLGAESAAKRAVIQDEINRTIAILTRAGIAIDQAEREIMEQYEDKAEAFYRETGMMAPGKDSRDGAFSYEERESAWRKFLTNGITGEGCK